MSLNALVANLQQDISLLQLYIQNRQDVGFQDMERMLESLLIQVLRATDDLNLVNKNILKGNFPAVDLVDDKMRIAVQVTSNATKQKIQKTIDTFKRNGLGANYDTLIIVGFCDAARSPVEPVLVVTMNQLIQKLIDKGESDRVEAVIDAIEQHHDYSRLHPYDDTRCLEVIVNCIDRNAIKHSMLCEGPYEAMIAGLNEITELISKGSIARRRRSKSIDQFKNEEIILFLHKIRDLISKILAIVNSHRNQSDLVCMDYSAMHRIDDLKQEIINQTNAMCDKFAIDTRIDFHTRPRPSRS